MAISYLVLPGKRSQPHISVLFLTVSLSLWYAAFDIMPGYSNACANEYDMSTGKNSTLCGIQGVLIIYLTQTSALWCSLLIYKLHLVSFCRSPFPFFFPSGLLFHLDRCLFFSRNIIYFEYVRGILLYAEDGRAVWMVVMTSKSTTTSSCLVFFCSNMPCPAKPCPNLLSTRRGKKKGSQLYGVGCLSKLLSILFSFPPIHPALHLSLPPCPSFTFLISQFMHEHNMKLISTRKVGQAKRITTLYYLSFMRSRYPYIHRHRHHHIHPCIALFRDWSPVPA